MIDAQWTKSRRELGDALNETVRIVGEAVERPDASLVEGIGFDKQRALFVDISRNLKRLDERGFYRRSDAVWNVLLAQHNKELRRFSDGVRLSKGVKASGDRYDLAQMSASVGETAANMVTFLDELITDPTHKTRFEQGADRLECWSVRLRRWQPLTHADETALMGLLVDVSEATDRLATTVERKLCDVVVAPVVSRVFVAADLSKSVDREADHYSDLMDHAPGLAPSMTSVRQWQVQRWASECGHQARLLRNAAVREANARTRVASGPTRRSLSENVGVRDGVLRTESQVLVAVIRNSLWESGFTRGRDLGADPEHLVLADQKVHEVTQSLQKASPGRSAVGDLSY